MSVGDSSSVIDNSLTPSRPSDLEETKSPPTSSHKNLELNQSLAAMSAPPIEPPQGATQSSTNASTISNIETSPQEGEFNDNELPKLKRGEDPTDTKAVLRLEIPDSEAESEFSSSLDRKSSQQATPENVLTSENVEEKVTKNDEASTAHASQPQSTSAAIGEVNVIPGLDEDHEAAPLLPGLEPSEDRTASSQTRSQRNQNIPLNRELEATQRLSGIHLSSKVDKELEDTQPGPTLDLDEYEETHPLMEEGIINLEEPSDTVPSEPRSGDVLSNITAEEAHHENAGFDPKASSGSTLENVVVERPVSTIESESKRKDHLVSIKPLQLDHVLEHQVGQKQYSQGSTTQGSLINSQIGDIDANSHAMEADQKSAKDGSLYMSQIEEIVKSQATEADQDYSNKPVLDDAIMNDVALALEEGPRLPDITHSTTIPSHDEEMPDPQAELQEEAPQIAMAIDNEDTIFVSSADLNMPETAPVTRQSQDDHNTTAPEQPVQKKAAMKSSSRSRNASGNRASSRNQKATVPQASEVPKQPFKRLLDDDNDNDAVPATGVSTEPPAPILDPVIEAKTSTASANEGPPSKDALMAELKAIKIAAIHARNASLQADIEKTRTNLAEVTKDLKHPAAKTVKQRIKLLHDYNEMRDVGQTLIGLIADNRNVPVREIYEEFGIGLKD